MLILYHLIIDESSFYIIHQSIHDTEKPPFIYGFYTIETRRKEYKKKKRKEIVHKTSRLEIQWLLNKWFFWTTETFRR